LGRFEVMLSSEKRGLWEFMMARSAIHRRDRSPPAAVKNRPNGKGRKIGIPFGRTRWCPVAALDAWLAASGLAEGAIFRPVDRHGRVHEGRLSGEGVALVLRERVAASGLRLL
jgi:hypothetical protein